MERKAISLDGGLLVMKITRISVVFLALAGCATPEDPKPEGPLSQVTVYREASPRDSLFPMVFAVDKRPLLRLQPEERQSFELPAGVYQFGYELGLYHCSADVRLESGKAYVYRLAQGCVIEAVGGEP